jgi:hypothetical protein
MGPIVSPSAVSDDQLDGAGICGTSANAATQGRCGYGPRLPLVVISPYAKANFVDHTVTDQSSILRFIEDNWGLGRLGNGSSDAWAGSLNNMFNFATGYSNPAVLLDPNRGQVSGTVTGTSGTGSTGGTGGSGSSGTKAVANPKNLFTTLVSVTLDGTKSVSGTGQLTYSWALAPNCPASEIAGANTATPTVYLLGGPGLYTFTLTVTDSTGTTATDTATVELLP